MEPLLSPAVRHSGFRYTQASNLSFIFRAENLTLFCHSLGLVDLHSTSIFLADLTRDLMLKLIFILLYLQRPPTKFYF